MKRLSILRTGVAVAALGFWSTASLAQEAGGGPEALSPPSVAAPAAESQQGPAPAAAPAAARPAQEGDDLLAQLDGRGPATSVVALTEQDLTAVSTGNVINAAEVASGNITLQDSALSGFSGVGNFLMNTGHNNNLQSSVSVTIIVTR